MLKPTASFKLSKTAKRMVALMRNTTQDQRNGWKRMFIDAELTAEHAKRTAGKRSKEDRASNKAD
jgi:hypothetical protein